MPATTIPRQRSTCSASPTDPVTIAERGLAAAYSDWHSHHDGAHIPGRNLHFCSPVTVGLADARRLLNRYVPGYNRFEPKRLKTLPSACRVRVAREGSVCLYVETTEVLDAVQTTRDLRCNEFDLCQVLGSVRTYRLWWD